MQTRTTVLVWAAWLLAAGCAGPGADRAGAPDRAPPVAVRPPAPAVPGRPLLPPTAPGRPLPPAPGRVPAPPLVASRVHPPPPPAPIPSPAIEPLPVPDHPRVSEMLVELQGSRRLTLSRALGRGQRYLPMIQRILEEEGLPEDLAYLALVESHFQPDARSPAGAVGLWQFIATTARASGLRVDWWVDERLDPELATRAAARHLKELYAQFGNWDLALAAYNAGPGGVSRMLAATGARTFWELVAAGAVRSETARYVPKFYAAVAVAREPERYGVEVVGRQAPLAYDTVRVDTPVDLVTAARLCGSTPVRLARLNPALVRRCTPPGPGRYPLRVPPGSGTRLARALGALSPAERLSFRRYRLRAGDTLWAVGRRFGTRPTAIAQLNGIADPRSLRPGRDLVVPVPVGGLKRRPSPADGGGTAGRCTWSGPGTRCPASPGRTAPRWSGSSPGTVWGATA